MKKSNILVPILIIGGIGYYLYKKKSAAATTGATSSTAGGLAPTVIANTQPVSAAGAVSVTGLAPVTGTFIPIATPTYNPFTTGNPFFNVIPGL